MSETEEKGHVKREPGSWREGEEDWRCLRAVPFQETRETRTTSSTTSSTTWVHAVTTIPGSCPGRSVVEHKGATLIAISTSHCMQRQLKNRPLGYFWRPPPGPLPLLRCGANLGLFFFWGCLWGVVLSLFLPGLAVWSGLAEMSPHVASTTHRLRQGKRLGVLSRDGEPFFLVLEIGSRAVLPKGPGVKK